MSTQLQKWTKLALAAIILLVLGKVLMAKFWAPNLSFVGLPIENKDNKQIVLTPQKGRYMLVSFFQSWCGDCIAEAPSMVELKKKIGPKEIDVVLISDEPWEKILQFQKRVDSEIQFFHTKESFSHLNIHVYPTTYLLSPEGKVMKSQVGRYDWANDEVVSLFK